MKDMTVEELIKYICDDCIAVDSPEFPDELLRRFEDLKCCGNCGGGYTTSEDRHFCARYLKLTKASCYCSSWQSDGLTRKEREGNYCSKWQSDNLTRKERE